MLGRRKTKQPVCALLTFLMAWASGQSQPRLASTRHYGSLSMPTFRRQGPPVSKWNGTEKGLQTVAERLESSRGLSESRNASQLQYFQGTQGAQPFSREVPDPVSLLAE